MVPMPLRISGLDNFALVEEDMTCLILEQEVILEISILLIKAAEH